MANHNASGQIGNKNASKTNRAWSEAIRMAVRRKEKLNKPGSLRDLADVFVEKVLSGDMTAVKEFGDRYEGKVTDKVELSGPEGGPIETATRPQLTKEEWLAAHAVGPATRTTE